MYVDRRHVYVGISDDIINFVTHTYLIDNNCNLDANSQSNNNTSIENTSHINKLKSEYISFIIINYNTSNNIDSKTQNSKKIILVILIIIIGNYRN